MKKLIFIILLSFGLFSCGSKKETTKDKEVIIKVDTFKVEKVVEKEVIKTEKVIDTFIVELPCDEKGNIKDFDRKIKTSGGMVRVYSRNGKVFAEMILEATENSKINSSEKEYKSKVYIKTRKVTYEKTYTKYKERIWLWLWFLGSIAYIVYKVKKYFSPIV